MSEMKYSGIPEIGNIPADWDSTKRIKDIFTPSKGLSITKEDLVDEGVSVISYGQIHSKLNSGTHIDPALIRYVEERHTRGCKGSRVSKGDFIFADTSEDLDGCGNCVYIDNDDVIYGGYHTVIFSSNRKDNRFLAYLFKTDAWRTQIRRNVYAVKVYTVSQKILKECKIILPPEWEQEAIADFLDKRCSELNSIIADLEQQIELLKAYKKSLITETITKGLDKRVPMKDSGIEWIGTIPDKWSVKKLRYLGSLQNGISKDADSFGTGYPFVSYGNVYNNMSLPFHVEGLVESTKADRVTYSVKRGDIFFTRTSETIEEIGFASTCLTDMDEATFAGFLIRFRPSLDVLLPEYAKYYFRAEALRKYFVKEMMIVTRASLGQHLLKNLPVLLPPMSVQRDIAEFLTKQCDTIDSIISNKTNQLQLIQKQKRSIIYEYVTGKKRVKEGQ